MMWGCHPHRNLLGQLGRLPRRTPLASPSTARHPCGLRRRARDALALHSSWAGTRPGRGHQEPPRLPVPVQLLPHRLRQRERSGAPHAQAHGGPAVPLRLLHHVLLAQGPPEQAPAEPHGRAPPRLRPLPQELHPQGQPAAARLAAPPVTPPPPVPCW